MFDPASSGLKSIVCQPDLEFMRISCPYSTVRVVRKYSWGNKLNASCQNASVRKGAAGECYYLDIIKYLKAPVERRQYIASEAQNKYSNPA
jgi:hypothetical protein